MEHKRKMLFLSMFLTVHELVFSLTDRCWKSQALIMFVATLGKIPLFLLFRLSLSVSSSSPVLRDATLPSNPSPGTEQHTSIMTYRVGLD